MLSITVNEPSKKSNSVQSMTAIMHNSIPVITTELLAQLYETNVNNIKVNHSRNAERFIEGKHYFKLTGSILKEFKHKVTQSNFVKVAQNIRHLTLWTERGAARHAKMLDTDKAWDVFEKLEDFYFNQKDVEAVATKTTVQQRNPLKNAVNLLVSKKGLLYPEAYSLVHQRFNVEHIDELTADQLPQAIEYVHKMALEGEYIPKDEKDEIEPNGLIHDEIVRLEKAVSMFNSGYELWRKNIFVNLIQMDVPLSGSINAMLKDSLSLLRDLKQRVSTRISAK
ncbi:ORF6N domain-containing protein [Xenorhabdus bovienii]|uniref:ORF6N domain-containing protein n=1 Tax=Xenorhabdus bovienii TaxID=40576 RepID=UPI0023B2F9AA|nr:ORF6N domain-containing protein [Xenorhabdus bovienii]MDE9483262.1 ORF6N domain-containing protein [Xenorhabdus bovienii]